MAEGNILRTPVRTPAATNTHVLAEPFLVVAHLVEHPVPHASPVGVPEGHASRHFVKPLDLARSVGSAPLTDIGIVGVEDIRGRETSARPTSYGIVN